MCISEAVRSVLLSGSCKCKAASMSQIVSNKHNQSHFANVNYVLRWHSTLHMVYRARFYWRCHVIWRHDRWRAPSTHRLEGKRFEESHDSESLDEPIKKKSKMKINNENAKSMRKELFVNYHSMLSKLGFKWIIEENKKLVVTYTLSAICPQPFRNGWNPTCSFHIPHYQKRFKKFLKHAVQCS